MKEEEEKSTSTTFEKEENLNKLYVYFLYMTKIFVF
ncbi:MAG: hypothetical protein BWY64_02816 [bacterium ADurb.Bin363]|nr:MAG: hypothetical protein BWY64_02816 [bacterium ADurb.Bin363]